MILRAATNSIRLVQPQRGVTRDFLAAENLKDARLEAVSVACSAFTDPPYGNHGPVQLQCHEGMAHVVAPSDGS